MRQKPTGNLPLRWLIFILQVSTISVLLLLTMQMTARATNDTLHPDEPDTINQKTFSSNYIVASFPGGTWKFLRAMSGSGVPIDHPTPYNFSVTVTFTITEKGKVVNIRASKAPEAFQTEAVEMIKRTGRWKPAKLNGKKVTSDIQQTFQFKMD